MNLLDEKKLKKIKLNHFLLYFKNNNFKLFIIINTINVIYSQKI